MKPKVCKNSKHYISLAVKPPPKFTKPLFRFTNGKTIQQNLKDKPRILHQLSLDAQSIDLSSYHTGKIEANLRQLKSLTCLKIPLNYLPQSGKGIRRLVNSLKHLKNLSELHLTQPTLFTMDPFTNEQAIALRNALKHLQGSHKLQIKLSFNVRYLIWNNDPLSIFRSLSNAKKPISLELKSEYVPGITETQRSIDQFRSKTSLSHFSLIIYGCQFSHHDFVSLQTFLDRLKDIKSLKV